MGVRIPLRSNSPIVKWTLYLSPKEKFLVQFQVGLMILEEIHGNLFEHLDDRTPTHCISQDCRMGAGIAAPMKKVFKLGSLTAENFPDCIYYHGVMNLITKKVYYGKPTYQTLEQSLLKMREVMREEGINRLVMPKIGCGLDRLQWPRVREMLEDIFQGTDADILVCHL